MEEAENICDEIVFINKGKIIEQGKTKDVLKDSNTDNLRDAFLKLIGGYNE